MSADVLREAAALMRERAEAATPGPWSGADEHGDLGPDATPAWCISRMRPGYESMSEVEGYMYDVAEIVHEDDRSEADCHQIASWHPAVALAVADWLDAMHERFVSEALYEHPGSCAPYEARALAVARAYLGSPDSG